MTTKTTKNAPKVRALNTMSLADLVAEFKTVTKTHDALRAKARKQEDGVFINGRINWLYGVREFNDLARRAREAAGRGGMGVGEHEAEAISRLAHIATTQGMKLYSDDEKLLRESGATATNAQAERVMQRQLALHWAILDRRPRNTTEAAMLLQHMLAEPCGTSFDDLTASKAPTRRLADILRVISR